MHRIHRFHVSGLVTALALGVFFSVSSTAFAATYYVSPTGSDSNNGTSTLLPLKTIQSAANRTLPGDTVQVMQGTYAGGILIPVSGTSGAPIIYKAYSGSTPVIQLGASDWFGIGVPAGISYITIDGFSVVGLANTLTQAQAEIMDMSTPVNNSFCIVAGGDPGQATTHHVVIRNNNVSLCSGTGIDAQHADYITIENNVVHDTSWWNRNGGSGISLYESTDIDTNTGYKNTVQNNILYNNVQYLTSYSLGIVTDGNGIIIDDNNDTQNIPHVPYGGRTLVANNVVYNNGASGILSYSSQHVDVINNTTYHNNTALNYGEILIKDSNDVSVFNNVLNASADKAVSIDGSSSALVWDYNLTFGGNASVMLGVHDQSGDPLFANAPADFQLQSTSPALDSGTPFLNTHLAPATDSIGVSRPQGPQYDKGAYESVTSVVIDTAAPSVPSGLSAAAISTTQISMNWNTSTDNVGVTGYTITRDGVTIGTSTTTSYTNTGLLASTTYVYTVSAFDAAGNVSGQSLPVSKTTLSQSVFPLNARIKTTAKVNVRSSASITTNILGTQTVGSVGTVVAGPNSGSGYTWWQINFDSGVDGFVVEKYLTLLNPNPPLVESASGSTATPGSGVLTDSAGNLWRVTSGKKVTKNGSPATSPDPTANTTLILWYNGSLYRQNNNKWNKWTAYPAAGTSASDPAQWSSVSGDPRNSALGISIPHAGPLVAVAPEDLTQPLVPGVKHPAVSALQKILNLDPSTLVSAVGLGSPGNETDYFGPMTTKAVQKFQEKYGIVTSGSPQSNGFGAVGPRTLKKLRQVMGW